MGVRIVSKTKIRQHITQNGTKIIHFCFECSIAPHPIAEQPVSSPQTVKHISTMLVPDNSCDCSQRTALAVTGFKQQTQQQLSNDMLNSHHSVLLDICSVAVCREPQCSHPVYAQASVYFINPDWSVTFCYTFPWQPGVD